MTSTLDLQIRLALTGVAPPIWRRLLVPAHIHLGQLHDVIQCAMGWMDSHLHEFVIGGRRLEPSSKAQPEMKRKAQPKPRKKT